jgi:hypothetical protein
MRCEAKGCQEHGKYLFKTMRLCFRHYATLRIEASK